MVVVALVASVLAGSTETATAHTPHDEVESLAISPDFAADQTVYAIVHRRLKRSTDGGASWHSMVAGIGGQPGGVIASPLDPDLLFAIQGFDRMVRSADGGDSWSEVAEIVLPVLVRPSVGDPDVVVASTLLSGSFRSADAGATWTAIDGVEEPLVEMRFLADGSGDAVAVDGTGQFYVSTDDAVSFVPGPTVTDVGSVTALGVGMTAAAAPLVIVGTDNGTLLESLDGGSSFAPLTSPTTDRIQSVAVSPDYATDATIWLSTWSEAVYRSTDGGVTWTLNDDGIVTDPQAQANGKPDFREVVVAPDGAGGHTLFLAGFDGLFRSDDDGTTWYPVETTLEEITGLAVSPDHANDGTVIATTYVKGAYMSEDAGATWNGRHVGLGAPVGAGNEVFPVRRLHNVVFSPDYAEDGTIFTAIWPRVMRSSDRGRTWEQIDVGPSPDGSQLRQFVIGISPDYAVDQTVYVGTQQGEIIRSTAGGDAGTWSVTATLDGWIRSLVLSDDFATQPTMYAGTSAGTHRSIDGGLTWAPSGPTGVARLAISSAYPADGTVFAGTASGLQLTTDGGTSWATVAVPPALATGFIEAVAVSPEYSSDGIVLASVRGQGLFKSTDGGSTFEAAAPDLLLANRVIRDYTRPTSNPIQFSPTFATDQTVYAYAAHEVLKSTDAGDSWTPLALPPAADLFVEPVLVAQSTEAEPVPEGATGTTSVLRIPVDLSHPFVEQVSVEWRTLDVTANPAFASSTGGDFTAASGTLVFSEGETRRYIEVVVNGDTLDETDELVAVQVLNPVNATVGGFYGLGLGRIDDDDGPTIVPGIVASPEGDSGTTVLSIPVRLSSSSPQTVSAEWTTLDTQAIGGEDFVAASGSVVFAPGETERAIEIEVYGDADPEPDEILAVLTHNPVDAEIGGFFGLGLLLLQNDD